MSDFNEEIKDIYRLKVPFENIYTSVFLVRSPSGVIVVDCATTGEDVDEYIVPALKKAEIEFSDVTMLITNTQNSIHTIAIKKHQPIG